MSVGRVTITLTGRQVLQVMRHAARTGLIDMLGDVADPGAVHDTLLSLLADDQYSRSTLRALLVLAAFHPDGSERELTDVARELAISPSTLHRYVGTWMAIGVLDQNPVSRRYKRVRVTLATREAVSELGEEAVGSAHG